MFNVDPQLYSESLVYRAEDTISNEMGADHNRDSGLTPKIF